MALRQSGLLGVKARRGREKAKEGGRVQIIIGFGLGLLTGALIGVTIASVLMS